MTRCKEVLIAISILKMNDMEIIPTLCMDSELSEAALAPTQPPSLFDIEQVLFEDSPPSSPGRAESPEV